MPQASEELRAAFAIYWGTSEHAEGNAERYLESRGCKIDRGLILYPHDLTKKGWVAINYLCDEWDYAAEEKPRQTLVARNS